MHPMAGGIGPAHSHRRLHRTATIAVWLPVCCLTVCRGRLKRFTNSAAKETRVQVGPGAHDDRRDRMVQRGKQSWHAVGLAQAEAQTASRKVPPGGHSVGPAPGHLRACEVRRAWMEPRASSWGQRPGGVKPAFQPQSLHCF